MPDNFTPGNPVLSGKSAVFYAVVAVILVLLADYVPWLVNGILALILIGLILRNSGGVSSAISSGVASIRGANK